MARSGRTLPGGRVDLLSDDADGGRTGPPGGRVRSPGRSLGPRGRRSCGPRGRRRCGPGGRRPCGPRGRRARGPHRGRAGGERLSVEDVAVARAAGAACSGGGPLIWGPGRTGLCGGRVRAAQRLGSCLSWSRACGGGACPSSPVLGGLCVGDVGRGRVRWRCEPLPPAGELKPAPGWGCRDVGARTLCRPSRGQVRRGRGCLSAASLLSLRAPPRTIGVRGRTTAPPTASVPRP